eukprot:6490675-Amphidinium_carterae.1
MTGKRKSSLEGDASLKKLAIGATKCSSCDIWWKDGGCAPCGLHLQIISQFVKREERSQPCSIQVLSVLLPHEEGIQWARMKPCKGTDTPMGDRCQQCDSVWRRGFSHMSWTAFCEGGEKVDKAKAEAKHVMNDPKAKGKWPFSVHSNVSYSFEVEKGYIVMNEAELRKYAGVTRINKKVLDSTQKVKVGEELLYCFKDTTEKFRKGKLRVSSDVVLAEHSMVEADLIWAGQACEHFKAKKAEHQEETHLAALLASTTLLSPEEFLVKKLGRENADSRGSHTSDAAVRLDKSDGSENDESGGEEDHHDDDDNEIEPLTELVSAKPAVSLHSMFAPSSSLPKKPRVQAKLTPLSKLRSSASLGDGASTVDDDEVGSIAATTALSRGGTPEGLSCLANCRIHKGRLALPLQN